MNFLLSNHANCLIAFNCAVIYHKHLDAGRGIDRNNHLGHIGFQMHLFTHRRSLQKTVLFQGMNNLPWWQTNCKSVIFMVWHFAVKVHERVYITFTGYFCLKTKLQVLHMMHIGFIEWWTLTRLGENGNSRFSILFQSPCYRT